MQIMKGSQQPLAQIEWSNSDGALPLCAQATLPGMRMRSRFGAIHECRTSHDGSHRKGHP